MAFWAQSVQLQNLEQFIRKNTKSGQIKKWHYKSHLVTGSSSQIASASGWTSRPDSHVSHLKARIFNRETYRICTDPQKFLASWSDIQIIWSPPVLEIRKLPTSGKFFRQVWKLTRSRRTFRISSRCEEATSVGSGVRRHTKFVNTIANS